MKTKLIALSATALLAAGCATTPSDDEYYAKFKVPDDLDW